MNKVRFEDNEGNLIYETSDVLIMFSKNFEFDGIQYEEYARFLKEKIERPWYLFGFSVKTYYLLIYLMEI